MTFKLVIFDFDGTLADTYPLFADSVNVLASKHGFRHIAKDEEFALRGKSAMEILQELEFPLWKVPLVLSDFRRIMSRRVDEIQPFPGINIIMRALQKRSVPLAIATSNSHNNVNAVLGDRLIGRFGAVECGSTLFGKSRRLHRILRNAGVDGADAIYIGDEIRDAEAAQRAGIPFGAVGWGYTHVDRLLRADPHRVFRVPADMLSLAAT